jgi:NADH dehydrogenase/NADH:ubiquinone oxidoreductase subunit G
LSDQLKITINGIETPCEKGDTILEAAKKAGVRIPTLCHDDRLEPYGGCRLCIVEVKGAPRPLSSCTTPVADN